MPAKGKLSSRTEWWVCKRYAANDAPVGCSKIPWDYWGPTCKTSRAAHAALDAMSDQDCDARRDDGFVVVRVEYHEEPPPPKAKKAKKVGTR